VEVRNAAGTVLTLPLQDISGGYVVKDIEGLDPVKAIIVTSGFANRDGVEYEAARRESRNIVLKLGFNPDWLTTTPKSLRDNLYKWFMTKQQVELRFYEDTGLVVSIVGRVESNDSPRFVSDPDASISILCFLPDFIGMTNELVSGNSTAGSTESVINYVGTSETGFLFTLNVNRSISGFALYLRGTDGIQYELDFAAALVSGDVVKISTVQGNKYATITHSGVTSSILYGISPSSPWLTLFPGANNLRLLISGAAIPYTIAYMDKYGGL
jgi:Phage tail protein